jgi:hypothetical protein
VKLHRARNMPLVIELGNLVDLRDEDVGVVKVLR